MKGLWALAGLAAMLPVSPLPAEIRPQPGVGDPRIQSVLYDANQVVLLQVAVGYQLSIALAADERIENVAVGDGGSWQVTPNKRGDHLFIKATQSGSPTNMTVVTDTRSYSFTLESVSAATPDMAYTVQFRYADPALATVVPGASPLMGTYRLAGAKALRPADVSDDGARTTINWYPRQVLPAVYTVDANGKDVLVNTNVRDGHTVIDDVFGKLSFRIGKATATATRIAPERAR